MGRFLWVLAVLPCGVVAEEVAVLSGAQIATALTGRAVIYEDGATQDFRASGATMYDAGRVSWGYWAVRENRYCSQWPPSDFWACYDMSEVDGGVRFIADDGSFTDGTYTD